MFRCLPPHSCPRVLLSSYSLHTLWWSLFQQFSFFFMFVLFSTSYVDIVISLGSCICFPSDDAMHRKITPEHFKRYTPFWSILLSFFSSNNVPINDFNSKHWCISHMYTVYHSRPTHMIPTANTRERVSILVWSLFCSDLGACNKRSIWYKGHYRWEKVWPRLWGHIRDRI